MALTTHHWGNWAAFVKLGTAAKIAAELYERRGHLRAAATYYRKAMRAWAEACANTHPGHARTEAAAISEIKHCRRKWIELEKRAGPLAVPAPN